MVGISILPGGITEKFRLSHLPPASSFESQWKNECAQYPLKTDTYVTLPGGTKPFPASQYIPPYCYPGATVDTYFASFMYTYTSDYITRALYTGDTIYSVSESGIKSWNLNNQSTPVYSLGFHMEAKPPYPRAIPVDVLEVAR